MENFDELYYREPYTKEFDAEVVACEKTDRGFEVELSQTAFYPLGGGQPGDRGTLAPAGAASAASDSPEAEASNADTAIRVLDTVRHDDRTFAVTDAPLEVGARVHGSLDWTWRRDNMEAHTGEHVVSGIVHKLYGYENIGFHMGDRCIEVDFDGVLTEDQTLDVEQRANAAVRQNIPVEVLLPSPEELEQMDYRSKKALEGPVRIVRIPGVDACACCGTHLSTTGEVGLIKILRVSTKKKKTRLELLCGRRALMACEDQMAELHGVSNFLSVADDEALDAVRRLSAERDDLKHQLKQAHRDAIDQEVAGLASTTEAMVRLEPGFDTDEQRYLAEKVVETGAAPICAVLAPAADDKGAGSKGDASVSAGTVRINYVIASADEDLRPACKELNARLRGRGGGKPHMVQGSFVAVPDDAVVAAREVLG